MTVVMIPIYKETPSDMELASLRQCVTVLGKYAMVLVCPENMCVKNYVDHMSCDVSVMRFKSHYFKSIRGYSKLLLSPFFYEQFLAYEWMLVYQLDAWVFKDALNHWCSQGYDYIGAPWFSQNTEGEGVLLEIAGNGGLSLRRIRAVLSVLKKPVRRSFVQILKEDPVWHYMTQYITCFWQKTTLYEDSALVRYGPVVDPHFLVAPPHVAMFFSFESQPKRLYEMTNRSLPFGCHAFQKHGDDFWKPIL